MSHTKGNFLKTYSNVLLMLSGIVIGSVLGIVFGKKIELIKPLGDIFLNLLFTAVVPLVFFTIASSIANIDQSKKFGKLMAVIFSVFVVTVLIAAILTVIGVKIFSIGDITIEKSFAVTAHTSGESLSSQIVDMFTSNEVFKLFSKNNMLALMLFSGLTGFAILQAGDSGKPFLTFINSGNAVFTRLLMLVMKLAPIGLGAYFANQVGIYGTKIISDYGRALGIYHGVGLFYYAVMFSVYAFIAGGANGIKKYWRNNIVPTITAVGTCSSIASIPANLEASRKMDIPEYIGDIVVPLGGTLHKEGSSISAIIKIAAMFSLFHKPFNGIDVLAIALLVSIVVSFVEGGIPAGGYLGEMLLMSIYHFPFEAFPVVIILGTLVDPFATILNVCGDTVSAMLVTRIVERKSDQKSLKTNPS